MIFKWVKDNKVIDTIEGENINDALESLDISDELFDSMDAFHDTYHTGYNGIEKGVWYELRRPMD